jgi:hypothetical protein
MPNNFILLNQNGQNFFQGDSGSPLMLQNDDGIVVALGVAKEGEDCAESTKKDKKIKRKPGNTNQTVMRSVFRKSFFQIFVQNRQTNSLESLCIELFNFLLLS